ncbi:MAG: DNA cytosine methyltransferase [Patescibacteria group bacterium]
MIKKLSVIDLFSGSGGSALGFQNAGFNIAAAVEIEKTAAETFKRNFPKSVVLNEDIRNISGKKLLKHAKIKSSTNVVLLACPPCQGFSSARRTSQRLKDPRNQLVWEFIRLVKEIEPVFFILENVPGLARGVGKPIFKSAVNELKAFGYHNFDYEIVDAADYGVPQRRHRLVFIGTRLPGLHVSIPNKTNQDPKSSDPFLKPWKTVRDSISDLPSIKAGEKDKKDELHISANVSETNLKRLRHTPKDGGSRTNWPKELFLKCHLNVAGYKDVYGRMRWDVPSPTITGGCGMITKGRFGHPEQNRAISLREAARLQSFPDSFKFIGTFGEITKQIGNAVPPLLARRIAIAIKQMLRFYYRDEEAVTFPGEYVPSQHI